MSTKYKHNKEANEDTATSVDTPTIVSNETVTNVTSSKRKCSTCDTTYPLTDEYFYYKDKSKSRFGVKCKKCKCSRRGRNLLNTTVKLQQPTKHPTVRLVEEPCETDNDLSSSNHTSNNTKTDESAIEVALDVIKLLKRWSFEQRNPHISQPLNQFRLTKENGLKVSNVFPIHTKMEGEEND